MTMKKIISVLLVFTMIFTATSTAFADSSENMVSDEESLLINTIVGEGDTINGAPAGVVFSGNNVAKGNYKIAGKLISLSVGAICAAIGLSGISAFVTKAVAKALDLGLSHVNWTKIISYGEDSNYYYTRTKIRLYSDSNREKPLTTWKTVYTKKSKNSGASEEGETE